MNAGLLHAAIASTSEKIEQEMRHHWVIENEISQVNPNIILSFS